MSQKQRSKTTASADLQPTAGESGEQDFGSNAFALSNMEGEEGGGADPQHTDIMQTIEMINDDFDGGMEDEDAGAWAKDVRDATKGRRPPVPRDAGEYSDTSIHLGEERDGLEGIRTNAAGEASSDAPGFQKLEKSAAKGQATIGKALVRFQKRYDRKFGGI